MASRGARKRALLGLLVRLEGVEAVGQALVDVVTHLVDASDEELEAFACDPSAVDRRALEEVRVRASMIADELDRMPLPRPLIPVAEAVADAAFVTAREAGRVSESDEPQQALEHLSEVDLVLARGYAKQARMRMADACEMCGLTDTAVYGGGLYL
jgi:hypothetical protein